MHPIKHAIATAGMAIMLVLPTATTIAANGDDLVPPGMTPVADVAPATPESCDVEPANPDRIREIAGDGASDPARVLDEDATPIAAGEVVSGSDAEAVIELASTFVGCLNANDLLRATTLLTDDLIARAAYDIVGSIDDLDEATPEPVEDDFLAAITKTTDVTQLADGRLAYSIGLGYTYPDDPREYVTDMYLQFIAAEQRGEWKIDDLIFYPEAEEPTDCGSAESDGCLQPSGTPISGATYRGYIMPAELASGGAIAFLDSADADAPAFTPTEVMVAEAEAALPAYVAAYPHATDRLVDGLAAYERQYLGFETQAGQVIVINAFCTSGFDPATNIVFVMDGGDCFWQATYDLTTHAFTRLSVNGNA